MFISFRFAPFGSRASRQMVSAGTGREATTFQCFALNRGRASRRLAQNLPALSQQAKNSLLLNDRPTKLIVSATLKLRTCLTATENSIRRNSCHLWKSLLTVLKKRLNPALRESYTKDIDFNLRTLSSTML